MPDDPHEPLSPPVGAPVAGSGKTAAGWRGWVWKALKILAVLVLLLAIFHRPLLQWTLTAVLYKVAARQNVSLKLEISGSMITNLTVRGVRAAPTGKGQSPVQKIEIEHMHFEYSLWKLMRGGPGEFLKSYEIRHANLEILAGPPKNEAEKRQKRTLASDLNRLLAQPALYADEVGVEDFNIRVQAPDGVTRVEDLHLFLHPKKPGSLRVETLQVPKLPAWRKLTATTSYAERNLILTGLELDPRIKIDRFRFDASRRAEKQGSVSLDARFFGGTLGLELEARQLPRKGEKLDKSYDTDLKVNAAGINIASAVKYFGGAELPVARLTSLQIAIRGEPERPSTWTGTLGAGVSAAALGDATLDQLSFQAEVVKGAARITQAGSTIGENTITFTGAATLPESVNRLRETGLELGWKINAPDLRELTIGFLPDEPIRGQLSGTGALAMVNQSLEVTVKLHLKKIAHALFDIETGDLSGTFTRPLKTPPGAPLHELGGKVAAKLAGLRFRNYRADSADVEGALAAERLTLGKLAVISGENSVTASGVFSFPKGQIVPLPIEADFTIKLPELAAMGVQIDESVLAGTVEGQGSLRTVNDRLVGAMKLEGAGVRSGDFRARKLAAEVTIDDTEALALTLNAESLGSSEIFVEEAKIVGNTPDIVEHVRDGRWHTIDADLTAAFSDPRYQKLHADRADVAVTVRDGLLTVSTVSLERGKNSATLDGAFRIVEGSPIPRPIDVDFAIDVPALAEFGAEVEDNALQGKIIGKGSLRSKSGRLSGEMQVQASDVRTEALKLESAQAAVKIDETESARVDLNVQGLESDTFGLRDAAFTGESSNVVAILNDWRWEQLNATIAAKVAAPRAGKFAADTATAAGTVRSGLLAVEKFELVRGENVVGVDGTFQFPQGKPVPQPVDAKFTLNIPELSAFAVELNREALDGSVQATGTIRSTNGELSGTVKFDATQLVIGTFGSEVLAGTIAVDATKNAQVSLRSAGLRIQDFSAQEAALTGQSIDLTKRIADSRWRELTTQISATFTEPSYRTYAAQSGELIGSMGDGIVSIDKLALRRGENAATGAGSFRLPVAKGSSELIRAEVTADVPDLSAFNIKKDKEVLDGRLVGQASVRNTDGQLSGTVRLEGESLVIADYRAVRVTAEGTLDQTQASSVLLRAESVTSRDLAFESAELNASADRFLLRKRGGVFENLDAAVSARFSALRYRTFNADEAEVAGQVRKRVATVDKLHIVKGENDVTAEGSLRFPGDGSAPVPIAVNYAVKIPELATFGLKVKDAPVGGTLEGSGALRTEAGVLTGTAQMNGSALRVGEFKAESLQGRIAATGNELTLEELRLQISPGTEIAASGKLGLAGVQPYEGAIVAVAEDLSVFKPLLTTLGIKKTLSGSIDLTVESGGQWRPQRHEGQVKLSADKVRYGDLDLSRVRVAGLFGPAFAETSEFQVISGVTQLQAGLSWQEKKLRVRDIELRQGAQQVLTGFALIPLDPGNPQGTIPMNQRVAANVNARDLDIAPFMKTFGQISPVNGTVTVSLVAGGTILRPTLHLKLAGRKLTSPTAPALKPAEMDLVSHYSNKELTLDLTARQPQIQPLTVRGRLPLDLEGTIQRKKLDPDLPLDLTVKLPQTSLGIVADLVPAIRSIEGNTAIDARISGTVRKPEFSGAATLRVGYARFLSEGVPAVGQLDASIGFNNDGLQVRNFRGDIGGGTFQLSGGIKVPRWFEPVFDLRLVSDSVLVRRDDALTVRVDTDIRATGPLAAGAVTGSIWTTQSRYFRDIEILPIGLPGRPKPKPAPRSAPGQANFAITKPPFNNWTFDVAIKTRPNDPFEIRGNLATGNAAADLRFGGTGAKPWLDGLVRVENFKATLPFSELEVTRGFITFSRDDFLRPTLDIMAQSRLRDYQINAYITGSPENPQLSLTSEPPLPQQDIVSLLATGATTSELTGGSNVLAGRAAVLVFEQLYRKVFKRQSGASKDPFLDRFDVDLGAVDSRTGRQELSATYRLGDNLYLVGDIDVAGEFTGRLRYLIRFR